MTVSFFPIPKSTVNLLPDGTNDLLSIISGVCILNVLRDKDLSFLQVPHYADLLILFTTSLL